MAAKHRYGMASSLYNRHCNYSYGCQDVVEKKIGLIGFAGFTAVITDTGMTPV